MVMDFVANILRVTGDKFEEAKVTFEPCLKTHYGADPEMARDIVQTFVHGKPYPSKILDGLTAGEVVMYADEKHRIHDVSVRVTKFGLLAFSIF